jgi:hypothetical protein
MHSPQILRQLGEIWSPPDITAATHSILNVDGNGGGCGNYNNPQQQPATYSSPTADRVSLLFLNVGKMSRNGSNEVRQLYTEIAVLRH